MTTPLGDPPSGRRDYSNQHNSEALKSAIEAALRDVLTHHIDTLREATAIQIQALREDLREQREDVKEQRFSLAEHIKEERERWNEYAFETEKNWEGWRKQAGEWEEVKNDIKPITSFFRDVKGIARILTWVIGILTMTGMLAAAWVGITDFWQRFVK